MLSQQNLRYEQAASWCREAVSSGSDFIFDSSLFHDTLQETSIQLDFPFESLHSFFRSTHLVHVKRSTHRVRESIQKHLEAYGKGNSILNIAKAINFSPYLLARLIVENVAVQQNKKSLTEAMRDPHLLADKSKIKAELLETETFARPDLINEKGDRNATRLSLEVMEAINADPMYGPRHDRERNVIGAEYELLLEVTLKKMDIPFETENELRERGTARTPDILLSCPVGIQVQKKNGVGKEWKVVCWIDSKALFGDENIHRTSVLPQAETYVHRFGPGLVLYWFGHAPIDMLDDGHGDVSIVGWNVPEVMMLPTGELVFQKNSHSTVDSTAENMKP